MAGARRLLAGIDIYNLTNADTVLAQNNTYTTNTTRVDAPDSDPDGALLQAERDLRLSNPRIVPLPRGVRSRFSTISGRSGSNCRRRRAPS
jgi:hypothetical protein